MSIHHEIFRLCFLTPIYNSHSRVSSFANSTDIARDTPPRGILNLQENIKAKKRNTGLQYLVRFILTIAKLEPRSSCLVDIQVLQDNNETAMSKKSLSSTISRIVARLQHLVCNDHVLLSKLWFKPYGNLSDNCYEVVMHMKHADSYITYNTNSRPEMILRLEFLRAAQRRSSNP